MSLFEVPGWSVPSAPVSNKKRKRPLSSVSEAKLKSTAAGIEKLMTSLSPGNNSETQLKKKVRKKGRGKRSSTRHSDLEVNPGGVTTPDTEILVGPPLEGASAGDIKEAGVAAKRGRHLHPTANSAEEGLTSLQTSMKNSLHGARFRWINETLYKSSSEHAHKMMRENPSVFSEYHTGFRHQVHSWPSNPVSHYISVLSSRPPRTVIVDLGCGDATLARALQPKGLIVLSYDLVSDNSFVVEADICTHIPLPGDEAGEGGDAAQVVDVVVCALSLMGTNWPGCIREAWRILKPGGELKIAEVASRFTSIEAFVSLVGSVGFKHRRTDDKNSHFTLLEFTKAPRKPRSRKEWGGVLARGDILKPCEYKRR